MATILRNSDTDSKRWFSTGFMAGGIQSVDADKHTLSGAVMIRPGEALGHGVWIDQEFCAAVAKLSAEGKNGTAGLKARFGHPNMCSEALGTFLGRWKNATIDEQGFVRGDLHLSSVASESPKGDLRNYVEQLAAKEPSHFGASVVFDRDWEAMKALLLANGGVEKVDMEGTYIDLENFKSPDPANVQNLPHARCAALHAADLVDSPAATDGMFSSVGGAALAAQMTEWLDTHPEVFRALSEPGVLDIVDRYKDELRPFVARYQANAPEDETPPAPPVENATCNKCGKRFNYEAQPEKSMGAVACPHCGETCTQENCDNERQSEPAAETAPATPETPAAEPAVDPAKLSALEAQAIADKSKIEQLSGECAATVTRAESLEAQNKALNGEREQLAASLESVKAEKANIETELAEVKQKLAAWESGQSPLSSVPAENAKGKSSMWDDARKTAKK